MQPGCACEHAMDMSKNSCVHSQAAQSMLPHRAPACWLPLLTDSSRKDGEVWSPDGTRLRYARTGVMRSLNRRSYSGTMLPRLAAFLKFSKPGRPGQSSSPQPSAWTR